eukprot:275391_1
MFCVFSKFAEFSVVDFHFFLMMCFNLSFFDAFSYNSANVCGRIEPCKCACNSSLGHFVNHCLSGISLYFLQILYITNPPAMNDPIITALLTVKRFGSCIFN